MELESGEVISNTMEIALHAAQLAGLQPVEEREAARVRECLQACSDLASIIGATGRLLDGNRACALARIAAPGGQLAQQMDVLESLCAKNVASGGDCGRAVGTTISAADIAMWRIAGGGIAAVEGLPADLRSRFPLLSKVVAAVDSEPKVRTWKSLHPKYGGRDVYGF